MNKLLAFLLSSAAGGIVMSLLSLPGEIRTEQKLYADLASDEEFQKAIAKKMAEEKEDEEDK